MTPSIVLASNNAGKLREFTALLAPHGIHLQAQSSFNIPECPEPHPTFIENALAKARHASTHSRLPALADDSGLCVPALGGAPGVLSARYGGNARLCAELHGGEACYYVCVLALVRHPNDPQPLIAEGIWHGQWQQQPAGDGGFGYDPHFYLPEHRQTAAELSAEHKNTLSHRARAWQQLAARLTEL